MVEIAVVGMSALLPQAEGIEEYREILSQGKDCIGAPPAGRNGGQGGYVRNADTFACQFFHIGRQEAEHMNPVQRKMLELVQKALEDGGFTQQYLKEKKIASVWAVGSNAYAELFDERDADREKLVLGSSSAMTAARISYHLNLTDIGYLVDTSCTSSLMAVRQACMALQNREADLALAGSMYLRIMSARHPHCEEDILQIVSSDRRTHSFAAAADGSGLGEGGGVLCLKRLEDAAKDGDLIHAVLKGIGTAQNGSRSNGPFSPCAAAQEEALMAAFEEAAMTPKEVKVLEGHGIGSAIGDAIELQALKNIYRGQTGRSIFLSSVKSNIGHLGISSGMASVLKCILEVKYGEIYPALHFEKEAGTNFLQTPFIVPQKYQKWENPKRSAALLNVGMNGSNAAMVIQNWIPPVRSVREPKGPFLFALSARSAADLKRSLYEYQVYLQHERVDPASLAYTSGVGREHQDCRRAFLFDNQKQLQRQIEQVLAEEQRPGNRKKVYMLCSGDEDLDHDRDNLGYVSERMKMHRQLNKLGIQVEKIIACGRGNLVISCIGREVQEIQQIVKEAGTVDNRLQDPQKFLQFIERLNRQGDCIFLSYSRGEMNRLLENCCEAEGNQMLYWSETAEDEKRIKAVYEAGGFIDWNRYYSGKGFTKISIPGYPMDRVVCWPGKEHRNG